MTIEDEIRRIAREEVERAMEEYTRPKAVPTTVKGKIINTLQVGGRPLSSIEICKALNMPKDTISPQLSKMHQQGLVTRTRVGRSFLYAVLLQRGS